jgi:hypothetical protein
MRPAVLALFLATLTTPVLAYCPVIPDDKSTHYIANQTELALCRQAELAALAKAKARELQFQADLQALQKQIEIQQRFQQMFAAQQQAFELPNF